MGGRRPSSAGTSVCLNSTARTSFARAPSSWIPADAAMATPFMRRSSSLRVPPEKRARGERPRAGAGAPRARVSAMSACGHGGDPRSPAPHRPDARIPAMSRRLVCVLVLALAGCGGGATQHARAAPTGSPAHPPEQAVNGPPAATWGAAARRARIPILMYHVITAAPPGAPFPQLWVSVDRFAEEMAALRRHGYHAVTLAAAV